MWLPQIVSDFIKERRLVMLYEAALKRGYQEAYKNIDKEGSPAVVLTRDKARCRFFHGSENRTGERYILDTLAIVPGATSIGSLIQDTPEYNAYLEFLRRHGLEEHA